MNKVRTVMKEFKSGSLKSSSGKKVTDPKQAIAIALSEARKAKSMKKGGEMKESKAMVRKEVSFMKKKGAPKSMIKHEESEMKGMRRGGETTAMRDARAERAGRKVTKDIEYDDKMNMMKKGGMAKYAKGGSVATKMGTVKTAAPSRDGVATKGKTRGTMVKMAGGGMTKKMKSGGKC